MKSGKKNISLKSTGNDPHDVLEFALQSYNMMGFARKLTGDAEKALDLYQDTAERILKYAPKLQHRGDSYTRGWATSIMYGIFVNKYRQERSIRKRDQRYYLETFTQDFTYFNSDTDEIPESELSSIVVDAMKLLTDRQRVVTFLFARDFQYREIADMLEIPIGTVMSTLGRCRKALKENEDFIKYVKSEYGLTA
jgi:RNA polymerase sigma-70 factor (ECF subfamily)